MTKAQRRARARKAAKTMWEKKRATKAVASLPAPVAAQIVERLFRVSTEAEIASKRKRVERNVFIPPKDMFPKAAIPPKPTLAMDSAVSSYGEWAYAMLNAQVLEGQTFLGYPVLAEMAQRPEYRRMVEQLAFHMTRRWIRIKHKAATPDGSAPPGFDDDGPLKGEPGFEEFKAKKNGAAKPNPFAKKATAQDEFPPPKPAAGAAPLEDGEELDSNGKPVKLSAAGTPLTEPLKTQEDHEREQRAKKVTELENELKRLNLKQHFKEIVEHDGFFGRAHLFIDLGMTLVDKELSTNIGEGFDEATKLKVNKGDLKGVKVVEPMWAYPQGYDSVDPLQPSWYRPDYWYVMKRQVHRSRFLTFVSREVSDMLKPAYAFGGLPLIQIAKPYVDNWLRTRQAVSDLVESYSQTIIMTDLLAQLSTGEGSTQLFKRLDVFNATRSNRGVMAVDKDREDVKNITTPLSSLDKLQAQSQEQMSSVSGIPIMLLLGDQPTGLNASSEGAIRAFYDWVQANQEFTLGQNLRTVIAMVQRSLWGEVDPDIDYEFVQLWTPTDKEAAEMRKSDADRDVAYIDAGVVHPEEVREKIASDPNSGYTLDLTKDLPEPPAPELPPGFGDDPDAPPGDDDNDEGAKPPQLQ